MNPQLRLSLYGALATIATATSLTSVFSGTAWVVPVMGAIILVSGTCALVRVSPLPSALEPVSAALAVLIWLTIIDAHSKAHLGVIPGRLAFRHLGNIAHTGFVQIHKQPTPAPAHRGLVLLTVVGVAAVALIVDLMTVTLRRAALSGLPLLALFTVCAATGHHGVSVVPFVVSAVGYLWLLYADNREKVARWGAAVGTGSRARPASAWSTDPSSAPAPASLGRQVGVVAISLSVVVPLFIPGLHTGIGKHGTGTGGTGSGTVQTYDPIVRIGADLQDQTVTPLIRYQTTSKTPGYIRLTSLDIFNGHAFSAAPLVAPANATVSETLPVTPPTGVITNTSFNVLPALHVRWLPVVATTLGVSLSNPWRYDPGTSTIFSAVSDADGLRYTDRSVPNQPTSTQLSSAGPAPGSLTPDLSLTAISPQVRALTRRVTAGATNDYDKAIAIQRFFTTGSRFTYDTKIPADNSPNALDNFLLHTRRGFCQQFATSMAVMARLSGIPARVAVGFTRGTYDSTTRTWTVTTHDAHAWPELYFQGYGWLPFEPTPRGDGQAVKPSYAKSSHKPAKGSQSTGPKVGPSRKPRIPSGLRNTPGTGTVPAGGSGAHHHHHSRSESIARWVVLVILLLAALLLSIPLAARTITRRRRSSDMTHPDLASAAAWAELRDTAVDYRLRWNDDKSPRQVAVDLISQVGSDRDVAIAMNALAIVEERSRYAPVPDRDVVELPAQVAVVQTAIRATATGSLKVIAVMVPRSTMLVATGTMGNLGDRLERMSRAGEQARSRLWRRVRLARP